MLTLHTWNTPNGQKPAIMLEELGLTYDIMMVDIGRGEQHEAGFRAISPNGKIPALVDGNQTMFESGAILMHLAEKHGQFLSTSGQARTDALVWTFWQVGGLGPMIGQWGHFSRLEEKHPYAIERYLAESIRLLEVMEERLASNAYLAGEDYTIADMMSFPWVKGGYKFLSTASPDRLPPLEATRAWVETIDARPAVQTALARLKS